MRDIKKGDQWTTRWGLAVSAMGMAIGTGNIWRFPRVAAAQGGGAFVIAVIAALFLWAIPLLMAESVWGKVTRMSTIGAFKEMLGRRWTWVGGCTAWISLSMCFYYAVVTGWCVRYLVYALMGVIKPGLDSEALWTTFSTAPGAMVPWHILSIVLAIFVVVRGVVQGIEKISKIFIPLLFVVLIILSVRAVTLPDAVDGLQFLFKPDFKTFLRARLWLEAFTQVAWSTGAGWGFVLTYYVYAKKDQDISLNATFIAFADTSAGLLALLAVIPTIFALSPDPGAAVASGNTGLAFIHLTSLFTIMPGGAFFATLFFLALSLAALSTLIAMVELGVRILMDAGCRSRRKATIITGIVMTVLGLPSSMSIDFLNNQDWVWGVGLLLGGLFFSIGAIKIGVDKIWKEYIEPVSDLKAAWMWKMVYLCPVWFVIIFGWWIQQAASSYPETYMKWLPISEYTYTLGTMLYQWGIMIVAFIVLNNWLADKMTHKFEPTE
jgi:NSS family neurotransmitter:Na+ symporter